MEGFTDSMKSPAFQFYVDDFLGGTVTFNNEQKGLYITLLCIQWSAGFVTDDDFLCLGSTTLEPQFNRVKAKFDRGEDGNLRNLRLEAERAKQMVWREKSRQGGLKSAAKRASTTLQPPYQGKGEPKGNSPLSTLHSPLVEREKDFAEPPPMNRKDYDAMAEMRGIPKECAEWFWNSCDARNWTDATGQPIRKVEPLLTNAFKNWRANIEKRKTSGPQFSRPQTHEISFIPDAIIK